MDIQPTDKESLATYVHRFKWEANRCKFNNDAATIRIFLNGLKNAHTIATKVYEKGPQTLSEAIKEVEKLQAAQQTTSSLLPTSSVNTMSSDNDRCFQCQEVSHMAHYCPHVQCYDCDNYGHVAMDCLDKILPSGTPAHHRTDPTTEVGDLPLDTPVTPDVHATTTGTDLDSVAPNPDPITTAIGVAAVKTPCRSRSRSFHRSSQCNLSHDRSSSSYHHHCDTPHHRPLSHRNTSQDDSRSQHRSRKHQYKPDQGSSSTSWAPSWKHKDRRHKQVKIDNPPSEYYSSDDNDSDYNEDLK